MFGYVYFNLSFLSTTIWLWRHAKPAAWKNRTPRQADSQPQGSVAGAGARGGGCACQHKRERFLTVGESCGEDGPEVGAFFFFGERLRRGGRRRRLEGLGIARPAALGGALEEEPGNGVAELEVEGAEGFGDDLSEDRRGGRGGRWFGKAGLGATGGFDFDGGEPDAEAVAKGADGAPGKGFSGVFARPPTGEFLAGIREEEVRGDENVESIVAVAGAEGVEIGVAAEVARGEGGG